MLRARRGADKRAGAYNPRVEIAPLHPWDLTPREAMRLQTELASRVIRTGAPDNASMRTVLGCDVAFDRRHGRGVAAIVALAWPSLEVLEEVTAEAPVRFPYVPGLLSFRETPVLLAAFERLHARPDLVMIDGHGFAHPRRFGFACHVGLLLDAPTLGIAKSRLTGASGPLRSERGARTDLIDDGEVIGAVVRTRQGVRPIFVSVGHRVSLAAAERLALEATRGYRLPEPARLADALSRRARQRMLDATAAMVVEQRAGEPGRWEWSACEDEVVYRGQREAMPLHYGAIVDALNPADGEPLDVMLVASGEPARGERIDVRVIDVLLRADGDHKLLAIPASHPDERVGDARDRAWRWSLALERPVTSWGGEDAAIALLKECREA